MSKTENMEVRPKNVLLDSIQTQVTISLKQTDTYTHTHTHTRIYIYCCFSVARSYLTVYDPMDGSTPGSLSFSIS